ncbi:maltodextrin phosphorylase [Candidatus Nitromaritima sp. SCGC AAA799-C22]|nr:maltodextrin phosphorylase [Candidatus Nitromaritima sp. SCGC AAA799-C22]
MTTDNILKPGPKNKARKITSDFLKHSFQHHLKYTLVDDQFSATKLDYYISLALSVRDRLVEKWLQTQQSYYENDVKRVYYLSMEFLIGRLLTNSLMNLGIYDEYKQALKELGHDLEELEETEVEAGLGNGGLGRLASCFLDSIATLGIPGYGYGIRYEFGIFYQKIIDGYQVETSDNWLRFGNPWEIPRPRSLFPVKFNGHVTSGTNSQGELFYHWEDTHDVMAMAHDIPIPGYKNNTVNNLRLWSARSTRELELDHFQAGDYFSAVQNKHQSEIISKVLYPNDRAAQGKELRLKQEYFFVSASLQDIIRRYKKHHTDFDEFSDKVAIQLNDTHPSLAVVELMRILVDEEGLPWARAWDITVKTFAYTNHTILPEGLGQWSVDLMGRILPRHLSIIYQINELLLKQVAHDFPNDPNRVGRVSLIEENHSKSVRMAQLAIVGSHSTNGVAELHSRIIKESIFRDYNEMFPERFNNKTNGISQRRWLNSCNPGLAGLINDHIGDSWVTHLKDLKKLLPKTEDPKFRDRWRQIKKKNKQRLADFIQKTLGVAIDADSLFEVQIKRIHEYKRQVLNILHVIALYNRIRKNPDSVQVPRTVIFSGKAAPGYAMAKLIVKLINSVSQTINEDRGVMGKLKVVFLPNYSVALAEKIIPAADLSDQISTAGMEASGTGNMKLALNGALTVGTLDGANIEIMEEVGKENIFIFGLNADEVRDLKQSGYNPREVYSKNHDLKEVLDMIQNGAFSPSESSLFQPILDNLLNHGDPYMLLADFASFCEIQERISRNFLDKDSWTRMSILNVANMGKFSSDRSIMEYARDIWNIEPAQPQNK